MPKIENCRLVEPFTGRMIVRLTREEAQSMEREGTARRTGSHTYVHVRPIPPSDSAETPTSLVNYDMQVVAGLHVASEREIERLAGWGFDAPKRREL